MASERPMPYVISSDVNGLMKRWSRTSGYQLPNDSFFQGLTFDLSGVLKGYFDGRLEIIPENEIRTGINGYISNSPYPIVSLDRAYVEEGTPKVEGFIDATRAVNENLEDIGLLERPGSPSLDAQLAKTASNGNNKPVILLDDVIFSGEGILKLAQTLERRGRQVKGIFAAIGIGTGVKRLKDAGLQVECLREYDSVVDEVCERDYFAGIPMSGRTVVSSTNGEIYSAPYFYPFGNPVKWASIPEDKTGEFSEFCCKQSIVLWAAVEKFSDARIPGKAIPRKLVGIPEDVSIVTSLQEIKYGKTHR